MYKAHCTLPGARLSGSASPAPFPVAPTPRGETNTTVHLHARVDPLVLIPIIAKRGCAVCPVGAPAANRNGLVTLIIQIHWSFGDSWMLLIGSAEHNICVVQWYEVGLGQSVSRMGKRGRVV